MSNCNISCTKAFKVHATRVKAGTRGTVHHLHEPSCGAQMSHVTHWRDRPCPSVQLGVPACVTVPEAEQILARRRAGVQLFGGGVGRRGGGC